MWFWMSKMSQFSVYILFTLFILSHAIYNGNKFSIKRCPFIVHVEGSNGQTTRIFAGTILTKNLVLSIRHFVVKSVNKIDNIKNKTNSYLCFVFSQISSKSGDNFRSGQHKIKESQTPQSEQDLAQIFHLRDAARGKLWIRSHSSTSCPSTELGQWRSSSAHAVLHGLLGSSG